ncbi:MAG: T9SS type A sorting domain-containing protein, partial [Bacteroidales bacterium]
SISIYPNPANDYVNVNIISPVSTNAIINISNILGQQVYSESINVKAGSTNVNINVNNLPAGMYIFSLQAEGKFLKTQKIIIE